MSSEKSHDEMYVAIAEQLENPRQLESLSRIKQACDYLAKNRIKVTPTSIERYCLDRGWNGPKAQSIRNSTNVLAKYMRLRCAGQTVPRAQVERTKEPAIHDESLRAYVMLLKQERDQAIAAKSRIEKALRSIPGIPADDLIRAGFGVPTDSLTPPVQPNFPIEVMHALRALLNPEILERCGLQLYKDRIRQTATRNVLVEASGVRILRSLLGDTAGPGEEASR